MYDPIRRALLDVSRRRSEEAARQQAAASAEAEEDIWTEVIGRKQQLYGEFIDYSNKKVAAFIFSPMNRKLRMSILPGPAKQNYIPGLHFFDLSSIFEEHLIALIYH